MASYQSMTAKSSLLGDDFHGADVPFSLPTSSYLGGDPVKIQASHLSDYLTCSGLPLQKLPQVDISMAPSKIRGSLLASPLPLPEVANLDVLQQEPKEVLDAPPGNWWFHPEDISTPQPWVDFWAHNADFSTPQYQLPQTLIFEPFESLYDPSIAPTAVPVAPPLPPTPPPPPLPPGLHVKPAMENSPVIHAVVPTADCDPTALSADSTELSGGGDSSVSDEDWSGYAEGSPTSTNAHKPNRQPQDSIVDGAEMGQFILSLLKEEPETVERQTSGGWESWDADALENQKTFGEQEGVQQDVVLMPPPGLTPPSQSPSTWLEPPPGLILSEASEKTPQISGSDTDVSDADVQSPCSSLESRETCDTLEPAGDYCVRDVSTDFPLADEKHVDKPKSPTCSEVAADSARCRSTKTRQPRVSVKKLPCKTTVSAVPANVEATPNTYQADEKKVVAPVSLPDSPSRTKARKQARSRPQSLPTSPSTEKVPDAEVDAAAPKFFWGLWWAVLLIVVLVGHAVGLEQHAVGVEPSLAYEVSASAMVAPGVSHAWLTSAPATANAGMWTQQVASLAKSMDIETARASAVASFLHGKIQEVRQVAKKARKPRKNKKKAQELPACGRSH